MALLHRYQQWLPGQERTRAGAGQDGGGHGDGTKDDGFQNALVPHEVIVDTEPVTNLCAGSESLRGGQPRGEDPLDLGGAAMNPERPGRDPRILALRGAPLTAFTLRSHVLPIAHDLRRCSRTQAASE